MNLDPEAKTNKVQEAIDHFGEKHAHGQAAELMLLHYKDEKLKEAAQLFAKVHDWESLATLSTRCPEIIEKIILPALKLESDIKINGLLDRISEFQTKLVRLQGVQENKRLMPIGLGEGLITDSDASSDFSELSSGSKKSSLSKKSGSSTASSSSRKSKTPKNLLKRKVKEGSVLEEEWLVGVLNQLKLDDKTKSKKT